MYMYNYRYPYRYLAIAQLLIAMNKQTQTCNKHSKYWEYYLQVVIIRALSLGEGIHVSRDFIRFLL